MYCYIKIHERSYIEAVPKLCLAGTIVNVQNQNLNSRVQQLDLWIVKLDVYIIIIIINSLF